jgi:hypothetical protein
VKKAFLIVYTVGCAGALGGVIQHNYGWVVWGAWNIVCMFAGFAVGTARFEEK